LLLWQWKWSRRAAGQTVEAATDSRSVLVSPAKILHDASAILPDVAAPVTIGGNWDLRVQHLPTVAEPRCATKATEKVTPQNDWPEVSLAIGRQGKLSALTNAAIVAEARRLGIPQIRERVYIVGSLLPLDQFVCPTTNNSKTNLASVLDDNPSEARKLSPQVKDCLEVWDDFLKACPADVELPSFPLWSMEWGASYPYEESTPYAEHLRNGLDGLKGYKGSHGEKIGYLKTFEQRWAALPSHARTAQLKFPKWKQNFIRQNRQFYQDNKAWIDPWLPKILKFPSSLQKFEWNCKGGVHSIWEYVIQFRASGVRVKRRTTAPSLIAMTDTQVPIIGWQRRYMTPWECARLQSLDGLKKLPNSPTKAFAALGNAVNSNVVEKVAQALLTSSPQLIVNGSRRAEAAVA
jgi:DNA (cytosine-5)-methyltransferase 1